MKFLSSLQYYFIAVIKKYTVISGRASRREFWMFVLASIIIGVLLSVLMVIPILGTIAWIVSSLFGLFILIPSITVGVRRLHDTNKTGWLMLLCLILLLGGIAVLVLCAFKGTPHKNKYGAKPRK